MRFSPLDFFFSPENVYAHVHLKISAGYGNIAPVTEQGKIATIFYAIIGMPLFLLYLSNIGNESPTYFSGF